MPPGSRRGRGPSPGQPIRRERSIKSAVRPTGASAYRASPSCGGKSAAAARGGMAWQVSSSSATSMTMSWASARASHWGRGTLWVMVACGSSMAPCCGPASPTVLGTERLPRNTVRDVRVQAAKLLRSAENRSRPARGVGMHVARRRGPWPTRCAGGRGDATAGWAGSQLADVPGRLPYEKVRDRHPADVVAGRAQREGRDDRVDREDFFGHGVLAGHGRRGVRGQRLVRRRVGRTLQRGGASGWPAVQAPPWLRVPSGI